RDSGPALTTALRCPTWVDLPHFTTGAFCLALKYCDEAAPSGILDLLSEHTARKSFNVEFFDGDDVEATDQPESHLVMEVEASSSNLVVLLAKQKDCFSPAIAPALATSDAALSTPKIRLRALVVARVLNLLAAGERRETLDSDVHTDALASRRKRLRRHIITAKAGVPVPISVK